MMLLARAVVRASAGARAGGWVRAASSGNGNLGGGGGGGGSGGGGGPVFEVSDYVPDDRDNRPDALEDLLDDDAVQYLGESKVSRALAQAAFDSGAETLDILKVGPQSGFTDFLVIATAQQSAVKAIGSDMVASARRALGDQADEAKHLLRTMGDQDWVSIDCGDVVGHVFSHQGNSRVELAQLWRSRIEGRDEDGGGSAGA